MIIFIAIAGLLSLPLLASHPASSDTVTVYKYMDAQGVLHLTSKPPPGITPKTVLFKKL